MRRTPLLLTGIAGIVVLLVALGVVLVSRLTGRGGQEDAAASFARAWTGGTLAQLAWDPASGPDPAGQVAAGTARLTPAKPDLPAAVDVAGVQRQGDRATADLDVSWALGTGPSWRYRTTLELHRDGGTWRPLLTPTLVHPGLAPGRVLSASVVQAERAQVVGGGGAVLVKPRPVVVVGIEPRRTKNLAGSVRTLAGLVDVDDAALLKRAKAAAPTAFVEVITLRREAYAPLRSRLQPVAGAVFREQTRPLAPTSTFARALLGTVGPATAEQVAAGKGTVRISDEVGQSGLQARFDKQLGGTPGVTVSTVNATGDPQPQQLFRTAPVPGKPLVLTLDEQIQTAADTALEKAPKPAALVALRPSTGEVLAVANGGAGGTGYNRALLGRYPPGSTFKIASGLALLEQGVRPSDPVACPATVSVSGKSFKNAEAEKLGAVPFSTDFALSCNTAFVGSAGRVTPEQLQQTARSVGYVPMDLGIGAAGGDVPAGDDPVEHAADMIGQGKVVASPLAVAVSAATAATGQLHPPRLLASAPAAAAAAPLPSGPSAALRDLMRGVVTSGTGTALKGVPGGSVSGKTGTAEFGTQVPPQTHAWFTGFQGDLAFVVLVEDGGFGGATAAPLAATFLREVRAGR